MNNQTIVCFIVALLLGMLLFHMLKNVCGCNNLIEGQEQEQGAAQDSTINTACAITKDKPHCGNIVNDPQCQQPVLNYKYLDKGVECMINPDAATTYFSDLGMSYEDLQSDPNIHLEESCKNCVNDQYDVSMDDHCQNLCCYGISGYEFANPDGSPRRCLETDSEKVVSSGNNFYFGNPDENRIRNILPRYPGVTTFQMEGTINIDPCEYINNNGLDYIDACETENKMASSPCPPVDPNSAPSPCEKCNWTRITNESCTSSTPMADAPGPCSGEEFSISKIYSMAAADPGVLAGPDGNGITTPTTPCLQCIGTDPSNWESKWPVCGGSTAGKLTDVQVTNTLSDVAAAQARATERTGAVFDFDNNTQS